MGDTIIMNLIIEKDTLLLVEGRDEVEFFEALLININAHERVQTIEVGGKDNFKNEFPALLLSPNFSNVKRYAIVRDADTSAKSTFQSVVGLLQRNNQPVPKAPGEIITTNGLSTGIFIMPGNFDEGMLEDLCLKTIVGHPVLKCVDKYFSCLYDNLSHEKENLSNDSNTYFYPKNESKAKMHAFLAGMNTFVPSLGIAAKKGYFNFDSEPLNEIKDFLQQLII